MRGRVQPVRVGQDLLHLPTRQIFHIDPEEHLPGHVRPDDPGGNHPLLLCRHRFRSVPRQVGLLDIVKDVL